MVRRAAYHSRIFFYTDKKTTNSSSHQDDSKRMRGGNGAYQLSFRLHRNLLSHPVCAHMLYLLLLFFCFVLFLSYIFSILFVHFSARFDVKHIIIIVIENMPFWFTWNLFSRCWPNKTKSNQIKSFLLIY